MTAIAGESTMHDRVKVSSVFGYAGGFKPEPAIRFGHQPSDVQSFVRKLAQAKGVASNLGNDTFVLAGVFYFRDAKSAVDQKARLIIPAQDFVAKHNVKTVFGMGGAYLNGSFVVFVAFTRETIDKSRIEPLMTLVNFFKTATMNAVVGGKLFVSG